MVVRFLPVPDPDAQAFSDPAPEREGLAEVVELRSRLLGAVAKSDADAWQGESDGDESPRGRNRGRQAEVSPLRSLDSARPQTKPRTRGHEKLARREQTASSETSDDVDAPEGPRRTATEDGVRVLSRRARSVGEVRRALLDLGHESFDVEDVLAEFIRSGYLDDADLARALTTSLRERSKASRSQIRRKLMERKIADHEIESALAELDGNDELALLSEAAHQRAGRMRDLDRVTAERRLLGFLARRGWSGESARAAVSEALSGIGLRR